MHISNLLFHMDPCRSFFLLKNLFLCVQLFYSVFKRLIGKEIVVELKNDLALRGTLHSVDQVRSISSMATTCFTVLGMHQDHTLKRSARYLLDAQAMSLVDFLRWHKKTYMLSPCTAPSPTYFRLGKISPVG
jgi:hypothetical protein